MPTEKMSSKYAEACIDYYSGKTSELIRQLALAGLAFTWLFFYKEKDGVKSVNPWLLAPILSFISSVAFDFLHYHIGYKNYSKAYTALDKLVDSDNDASKSNEKNMT